MSSLIQPYRFGGTGVNFPTWLSTTGSVQDVVTTSHVFTMPGTINAGDLLIAVLTLNSVSASSWSGSFTEFTDAGAVANNIAAAWKIAAGGDTVTCTSSGASRSAKHLIRIQAGTFNTSQVPVAGTSATGTSTAPNPPNLTPAWGLFKNLFIAVSGHNTAGASPPTAITGWPTNYGTGQTSTGGGAGSGGNNRLGTACRQLEAASDNPGTFTLAASNTWRAQTIAIKGL